MTSLGILVLLLCHIISVLVFQKCDGLLLVLVMIAYRCTPHTFAIHSINLSDCLHKVVLSFFYWEPLSSDILSHKSKCPETHLSSLVSDLGLQWAFIWPNLHLQNGLKGALHPLEHLCFPQQGPHPHVLHLHSNLLWYLTTWSHWQMFQRDIDHGTPKTCLLQSSKLFYLYLVKIMPRCPPQAVIVTLFCTFRTAYCMLLPLLILLGLMLLISMGQWMTLILQMIYLSIMNLNQNQ